MSQRCHNRTGAFANKSQSMIPSDEKRLPINDVHFFVGGQMRRPTPIIQPLHVRVAAVAP
jgi:hypothetical protein